MEWMLLPYRKLYKLIEGRAPRREYWMFTLLVFIVMVVMVGLILSVAGGLGAMMPNAQNAGSLDGSGALGAMMGSMGIGAIVVFFVFYVWLLLTGVASFAVSVRRLHDLNLSGWFIVLFYAVLIGCALISMWLYWAAAIGSIVVMCLPGTAGSNKYGANPYEPGGPEVFA